MLQPERDLNYIALRDKIACVNGLFSGLYFLKEQKNYTKNPWFSNENQGENVFYRLKPRSQDL